jgi:hypothetical protein
VKETAFFLFPFAVFAAAEPSQAHEAGKATTTAPEAAPISGVAQPRPAADEPKAKFENPATLPADGNPLSKISLSALSATRDRPLFSLSRRPPPKLSALLPPPAPHPPPPPPPPPPRPLAPPLTLLGTVVSQDKRVAIFFDQSARRNTRLQEGSEEEGWHLKSILPRSAVVEKDGSTVTIELPKPAVNSAAIGKQAETPAAVGAAETRPSRQQANWHIPQRAVGAAETRFSPRQSN